MAKSPEHYEPSAEEFEKAEEIMTDEEKELSQNRSDTFEAGKGAGKSETKKDWNERAWQMDMTPTGEGELTEEEKRLGWPKIFYSKKELEPLRCAMYRDKDNNDIRFDFSSSNKGDENQNFELVINDETHVVVKLRPMPKIEGSPRPEKSFGNVIISREEMAEAVKNMKKAMLIFRLKRLEKEQ